MTPEYSKSASTTSKSKRNHGRSSTKPADTLDDIQDLMKTGNLSFQDAFDVYKLTLAKEQLGHASREMKAADARAKVFADAIRDLSESLGEVAQSLEASDTRYTSD